MIQVVQVNNGRVDDAHAAAALLQLADEINRLTATLDRVRELALMGGQDPADIRRQIIAVVGTDRGE